MYKRAVIKIGTNVITQNGSLDEAAVERIVEQVARLKADGVEAVLVTSGAVASGKGVLGKSGDSISERQVFAAVGQIDLMSLYARLFKSRGFFAAQVLVTKGDFRDREHYANMKNCFETLLAEGIVPVVNENDTIAIQELQFSDNDEVAGLIASQINADIVLFLSSVDGVLSEGSVVAEVDSASIDSVAKHVTKERSGGGRGGMETKFKLAKKLMDHGVTVYVANGKQEGVILDIMEGNAVGTKFVAQGKLSAVKRRLAHTGGFSKGMAYVNKGAEEVLHSKEAKSLLPVGITKIEGSFKKGDTIDILSEDGVKFGSGVAQYGSEEAQKLLGKQGGKALVHYDYLFIE